MKGYETTQAAPIISTVELIIAKKIRSQNISIHPKDEDL